MIKKSFSIREAAECSGVGRTMLYAEIKAGRLVARKMGRRTLIAEADLERWLYQLPTIRSASQISSDEI